MTISEKGQSLVDDFSFMEDWTEKYQYLIDLSKNLAPMDNEFKVDDNLIKGCQSKVWLKASFENELINFQADSDAIISKGIVAILLSVLNDRKPNEILNADLSFIDQIGLKEHLSPNRANGLSSMIKQIKLYAEKRPELLRLISVNFKCGLDLCIDYINKELNIVEPVVHIEWDFFNVADLISASKEIEEKIESGCIEKTLPAILEFNKLARNNKIDAFTQADVRSLLIFGHKSYKLIPTI